MENSIYESIDEASPNLNPKQKKKLAEAIENHFKGIPFKDSLEINDDTIEFIYAQGHKLFMTQKYGESAKIFQFLYLLNPMDPRYALGIGASYQMAKNYDTAIGWYLALTLIDEESPLPYYYISDCFLKSELPEASLEFLKKTMERCGDLPKYSTLKSKVEVMINSLEEQIARKGSKEVSK